MSKQIVEMDAGWGFILGMMFIGILIMASKPETIRYSVVLLIVFTIWLIIPTINQYRDKK